MARVFYFAYGSNMDRATLWERRGIRWARACPALAHGWRLAVDKPSLLGSGEAMATLVPDPSSETWGVLFDISGEDFEHLELTEGVRIGHYRRVELELQTTESWTGIPASETAVTLTSDIRDANLRPTTRYMGLLIRGAVEHGLPEEWIRSLSCIETVEETEEMASLAPMRDMALRKLRG